jgi:RNA polymerase sigma factor for flagellar operon FliA
MDEAARKRLWADYARTKSPEIREKIILEYAPLVKVVAGRLGMYLGNNVEFDDLVGYGVFGLIDAIDKYDSMKDVKFETYASLRIRGSILDQIRKMDWIPRTIRQKQKQIETAMRQIEQETGRAATDEEIALSLGISDEEYSQWQSQMKITGVVSLNEYLEQGSDISNERGRVSHQFEQPEKQVEQQELKQMLLDALDLLTEKEKKVITLYYYEDLTLKEISNILEVSESRVSQLHTKGLSKMKTKLGNYMGILHGAV